MSAIAGGSVVGTGFDVAGTVVGLATPSSTSSPVAQRGGQDVPIALDDHYPAIDRLDHDCEALFLETVAGRGRVQVGQAGGKLRDLLPAAIFVAEESCDDEDEREGRNDPRPLLLAFALGVGGGHVVLSGASQATR